jgi:hypothetical protein
MLEAGADAKEIAMLARAIKDLAGVERSRVEIEAKAQAEATARATKSAADAVDRVGAAMKIDPDALRRIREEVYGITPQARDAGATQAGGAGA